jgi:NAD+ synthase
MPRNHKFDPERAKSTITRFITGKLLQSGLSGYVIGLSGGIDSALSCTLAVQAVGADKVLAVIMPYRTSSEDSAGDALLLIEWLGIDHRKVDISRMIDAYYDRIDENNRLRAGNKMARERMSILFDIAHETGRMVLGTGNRSEICLGYTTLYGDSACSINPNGDLYKTEVRALARHLGIPQQIIDKPPSADLWAGQTDEDEIGVTYEQIDKLLMRMVDDGERSMSTLEAEGFATTDISRVVSLINRNEFKRRMPDIAPLDRPAIPQRVQLDS